MQYLTNAHTHLELTGLADICPTSPLPFFDWLHKQLIPRLVFNKKPNRVKVAIEQGILQLKACGTTHVCDISSTWQSVEPLLESGLSGVVYLEVLGIKLSRAIRRLQKVTAFIEQKRRNHSHSPMQIGLSLHSPYTCHPELLRQGAQWCKDHGVPLCIHVAESPQELVWLESGKPPSIPLANRLIMELTGEWPRCFTGLRPIPYIKSLGVLDAKPLLIHAVQVIPDEIDMIAHSESCVVHCPRSNYLLNTGAMPLKGYLDAGVPVFLGTDSLTSSPDLNILNEVSFALRIHENEISLSTLEKLSQQPFPIFSS